MSVAKLQLIAAGGGFQHVYPAWFIILGLTWFLLPNLDWFTKQGAKKLLKF